MPAHITDRSIHAMILGKKACRLCKVEKDLFEFYPDPRCVGGVKGDIDKWREVDIKESSLDA